MSPVCHKSVFYQNGNHIIAQPMPNNCAGTQFSAAKDHFEILYGHPQLGIKIHEARKNYQKVVRSSAIAEFLYLSFS